MVAVGGGAGHDIYGLGAEEGDVVCTRRGGGGGEDGVVGRVGWRG
jgi:hypothetical protein